MGVFRNGLKWIYAIKWTMINFINWPAEYDQIQKNTQKGKKFDSVLPELCLALTSNYYYCCLQSDKQKWDNKKIGTLYNLKYLVQSSSKNKIND